jgi:hypothetical protein
MWHLLSETSFTPFEGTLTKEGGEQRLVIRTTAHQPLRQQLSVDTQRPFTLLVSIVL